MRHSARTPHPQETERLAVLERYDVLDTPPERAFEDIVWLAAQTLYAPIAAINFVDGHRQWSKACLGTATLTGDRAHSFCAHTVTSTETFIVPDARGDARFQGNPYVTGEPGICFYAGAPIRTPDGHVLGTLCIIDHVPRFLSQAEQDVLERLAGLVTSELELRLANRALQVKQQHLQRAHQEMRAASLGARQSDQQAQEARASEARYRALVEATSEIVWMTPPSGTFETDQPAWRTYTGQRTEELLGWGWVEALHPDDRDSIVEAWKGAQHSCTPFQANVRVRRHDGVYRSMQVRAVPVLNDDGALREWVGVLVDVTEHQRAEHQLRVRTQALEHANQELEAFAYSVSHDLRTPVRHIGGFLRLGRSALRAHPDVKVDRYLSLAEEATVRMDTLIDAMLTLSVTSMQPLRPGPVDLRELVARTRQDIEPDLVDRDVRWVVGELPVVHGDSRTLRLALTNLLSNAVKYTRRRATAVIQVWCEAHPDEWVICVKDNGAGFDPRYQHQLFGVFQRLHRAEDFEGTGVGLANVRRIIHRHGGRVWAEGKPGEGAVFGFSLPKFPVGTAEHHQA